MFIKSRHTNNDTVFYTYSQSGFDSLLNAISEYQAAFDNVKAARGEGYVYYFQKKQLCRSKSCICKII
ncbi:MAG: hypothetical protein EKK39_06210 [Sphingobacteriales bacterium]|uniref:hypothetical protein n=1 Tax=Hydrotalea flava TaxID=714549 RepID=UPI000FACC7E9|nr:hypothetical protein [Hydrotalea flava]RTL53412.1 MAG: hypothetical protein EKK39_06210 [Sphingobacteriales bacterium]